MRLLVVEDDPMIGESMQRGLKKTGFAVDWVRDGKSAEHALGNGVYDMMILDLGLPRKGGLELLSQLRERGNDLPVLIVTARDTVDDKVAGLNSGADDYLVKPFDFNELNARVNAIMRRHSVLGQPGNDLRCATIAPVAVGIPGGGGMESRLHEPPAGGPAAAQLPFECGTAIERRTAGRVGDLHCPGAGPAAQQRRRTARPLHRTFPFGQRAALRLHGR